MIYKKMHNIKGDFPTPWRLKNGSACPSFLDCEARNHRTCSLTCRIIYTEYNITQRINLNLALQSSATFMSSFPT